ncbi:hypothetical protein [Butyrivibrio sp. JL13D10]|uniref:hypothetical protein n=1 Tax=Butyrivibrio sp. JL13D10 TaxID=3236815 RepID=UPI0038B4FB71
MYEIGSEFNLEKKSMREDLVALLSGEAQRSNRYSEFLRCGRDAIGFVADDIIAKVNDPIRVLMPALSCDSMVKPFEVRGLNVDYYKLQEDLSVNEGELIEMLSNIASGDEETTPVILLMNFFGMSDISDVVRRIKESCSKAIIIEDITHVLLEPESYLMKDSFADYHVGSIRKWLGVPDGAVAISKTEFVMGALTGETDFTALRTQALIEKSEYLDNGDQELKDHFRKLLSDAEDSLSDGLDPYHMSDVSSEYLSDLNIENIRSRRSANYRNLYRLLKNAPLCDKAYRMLPEIEDSGDGYRSTPFMLPIMLDIDFMRRSAITEEGKNITRDSFEKMLAKRGVYAPVLWPVSDEAAEICDNSKNYSENMLAFWIDQRYSRFDMENVAAIVSEELGKL